MARWRSGKKIDFVHWTGATGTSFAQSAGSVAVLLASALHEPETILRMRGSLLSFVDGVQAPGGSVVVSVGIILVPEGTSSTVLWSPITDRDAPWIWIDQFSLGYEEMVTDVIDVPGLTSYRSVIDNKAMRIIRNQEIQLVVEQATLGTALSINTVVQLRVLSGT